LPNFDVLVEKSFTRRPLCLFDEGLMRAIWIALIVAGVTRGAELMAQAPRSTQAHDAQMEERFVLLTAKVKKMAEIQDLMVQQQQLVLQQLDALRDGLDAAKRDRSNAVARADFDALVGSVEHLEKRLDCAQETNWQSTTSLVQAALASTQPAFVPAATPPPLASISPTTNAVPASAANGSAPPKFAAYRVQSGDTLLKIVARTNELLEKNRVPKVTQEQIEKANPGLNADKIRVGQVLWLPVVASP
jgi:LysM repeat protein